MQLLVVVGILLFAVLATRFVIRDRQAQIRRDEFLRRHFVRMNQFDDIDDAIRSSLEEGSD